MQTQESPLREGLKEETAERKVSSVISESLSTINPENVLAALIVAIISTIIFLIATTVVEAMGVI